MPRRRRRSAKDQLQAFPPESPTLMHLARNILEQLTLRGILPIEDLRERLCCASELRMRTAIDELRSMGMIHVGEGKDLLVSLVGERRPYYPSGRRA
jgi:hypothetical protein